jgi:hypothetical protein
MKLEVIGLLDTGGSSQVQAAPLDQVVIDQVKQVTVEVEQVLKTVDKIEKGHLDWENVD